MGFRPGLPTWWLSFYDYSRPADEQFLGATIQHAWNERSAVTIAHVEGRSIPGAEVVAVRLDGEVPQGCLRRLFTPDEVEPMDAELARRWIEELSQFDTSDGG